jgi:hypothetical protein
MGTSATSWWLIHRELYVKEGLQHGIQVTMGVKISILTARRACGLAPVSCTIPCKSGYKILKYKLC